jgi:flagellar hook-associated protein 1 FlgK
MGLSSAINIATSGLALNQRETDLVSQNIARGDQAGYTRKRLISADFVGNYGTIGLRGVVQREVDLEVQRQVVGTLPATGYAGIQSRYASRLDQLMGAPGASTSLASSLSAMIESLQALATSPDSLTARLQASNQAQTMASRLNQMTSDVQEMRTQIEGQIATSVDRLNAQTAAVAGYNERIVAQQAAGQDTTALEDARDLAVKDIATLVDIDTRVAKNGQMTVFTKSGLTLVDAQAIKLGFDQTGTLTANTLYDTDPSKRMVGTITVGDASSSPVDIIADGYFRSGEIAGLVDARDRMLVEAQNQLDQFAASLASALSDKPVASTAASSGAQQGFDLDLTGLQPGNVMSLTYRDAATGRDQTVSFIRVNDPASLPLDGKVTANPDDRVVGLDYSLGFANVVTQIQNALGPNFTVANPSGQTVQILDDGATNRVDIKSLGARVTLAGTTGDSGLPLFTDGGGGTLYTGRLDDPPQLRGFAGRIAVNPAIAADPSLLVTWNGPATLAGDPTRPNALLDRLRTTQFEYGADTGIVAGTTSFTATISGFADSMINHWGAVAEEASAAKDTQDTMQANIDARYKESSTVSIDQELARLIQLQSSYSANARVMQTVREMLQTLMNV